MIDLSQYYWAGEAARVISKNNERRVDPEYVRGLASKGVLHPVQVNGRNLYSKEEIEAVVVGRRGKQCTEDVA